MVWLFTVYISLRISYIHGKLNLALYTEWGTCQGGRVGKGVRGGTWENEVDDGVVEEDAGGDGV